MNTVVVMLTKEFFKGHPMAGKPTNFSTLVKQGKKIHTCRDNHDYWAGKIEALKKNGGVLSIREWSGKPYRSNQNVIMDVPASEVHVSTLELHRIITVYNEKRYYATIGGKPISMAKLAGNDGFNFQTDFEAFLDPIFDMRGADVVKLAIIHFNSYRYE